MGPGAVTDTGMTTAITNTEPVAQAVSAMPAATLLQLMWLASPALPVGGFSYSEGLESAVDGGLVTNEAQAGDWLLAQLRLNLARNELPALAQLCQAWQAFDADRVEHLNGWLRQTRETAELRAMAEQMGRSMLDWLRNTPQGADPRIELLASLKPAPLWPTSFALATVLAGAAPHDALLAFAWGWAENMAQASMKAVPLGQAAAQRALGRLAAVIPEIVDAALALPDEQRQAFSPMFAILSSRHETQYSRLFRS
jgi:urease accessory protein